MAARKRRSPSSHILWRIEGSHRSAPPPSLPPRAGEGLGRGKRGSRGGATAVAVDSRLRGNDKPQNDAALGDRALGADDRKDLLNGVRRCRLLRYEDADQGAPPWRTLDDQLAAMGLRQTLGD